jgi:hypothetical protein
MRHGLQYGEIKTTALTVSNVRVSSVCRLENREARPDVPLRAAIASEPLKNVCDSCLEKRPYGRVNVFRVAK